MVTDSPPAPTRVVTAASKSPAPAMPASNCRRPTAVTDTMSGTNERAMSKSWIAMSRKIPPETRT